MRGLRAAGCKASKTSTTATTRPITTPWALRYLRRRFGRRRLACGRSSRKSPARGALRRPNRKPPRRKRSALLYSLRRAARRTRIVWNFDLCSVTLGNFKYRKMSLVRDYETLLADSPVNAAFEATFSLEPRPAERQLPPAVPLEDRFHVVPSDPTQASAIEEARSGTNYIIQGPPGTGKSQTITNLIADYVARGKRVLFVCEKRAAIDVVYARLRQCGLGDLCCLIHDSQTDKKGFVMDLKQTYEGLLGGTDAGRKPADSEPRAYVERTLTVRNSSAGSRMNFARWSSSMRQCRARRST